MELGQVYKDKDVKHVFLRIEAVGPDGWNEVSFNFKKLKPNRFRYHTAYIESFYELFSQG